MLLFFTGGWGGGAEMTLLFSNYVTWHTARDIVTLHRYTGELPVARAN